MSVFDARVHEPTSYGIADGSARRFFGPGALGTPASGLSGHVAALCVEKGPCAGVWISSFSQHLHIPKVLGFVAAVAGAFVVVSVAAPAFVVSPKAVPVVKSMSCGQTSNLPPGSSSPENASPQTTQFEPVAWSFLQHA